MEHEWVLRNKLHVCKKCGIVQRKDGKNKLCKGFVKVTTRSTKANLLEEITRLNKRIKVLEKNCKEGWDNFILYRRLYAELKYPGMTNKIALVLQKCVESNDGCLKQAGLQFRDKLIEIGFDETAANTIATEAFPEMSEK